QITPDIASSGSSTPNPLRTMTMVIICPATASQRSCISRMTLRRADASVARLPAVVGRAAASAGLTMPSGRPIMLVQRRKARPFTSVGRAAIGIRRVVGQAPAQPPLVMHEIAKAAKHHGRERKPGQRVEEMVVGKAHDRQA